MNYLLPLIQGLSCHRSQHENGGWQAAPIDYTKSPDGARNHTVQCLLANNLRAASTINIEMMGGNWVNTQRPCSEAETASGDGCGPSRYAQESAGRGNRGGRPPRSPNQAIQTDRSS